MLRNEEDIATLVNLGNYPMCVVNGSQLAPYQILNNFTGICWLSLMNHCGHLELFNFAHRQTGLNPTMIVNVLCKHVAQRIGLKVCVGKTAH